LIDETILNLIIAFYAILANFVFAISCRHRRDLLLWLIGTTTFAIGAVFIYLQTNGAIFYTLGNLFYLLSILFLNVFISKEYYQVFLKKEESYDSHTSRIKQTVILLSIVTITVITIQITLVIISFLAIFMLLRIYLRKRTITRLFMFLTILTGVLTLILKILYNAHIEEAWELSYFTNILVVSFLLITGLAAPIEDRITKSEAKYFEAYNQAEFYKDLFAHDISNILQYVKSSLDLIKIYQEDPQGKNQTNKVINILNEQTIRGSYLVKNVRTLSELTEAETEIKIKSMNLIKILNAGIDYINKTYPTKDINISIIPSEGDFYVIANELLLNVIENLIINAIKYNKNPRIEIKIEISPTKKNGKNYLKIEFKDNGIGVSNQIKNSLFKIIMMKEGKTEGMALSLLLVKKILDFYGADIWVEDRITGEPSKGSNFIIQIPEGS
jgi:signal transduction histidine kinase